MESISSGDEIGSNQPWWISPLYKFGVPAGIAVFLIWFLTSRVETKLDQVDHKLNQHIGDSIRDANQNERMLRLLSQICINSSATNDERNRCFQ